MLPEITRFFELLAAATDDTFEILAQSVETFVADLEAEISSISEDIETILAVDLFEEDLDWGPRNHRAYWIYDRSTEQWHYRTPPRGTPGFPAAHVGDPSCRFNALSPQLRCAVNPHGPCEGCKDYEPHPPTSPES